MEGQVDGAEGGGECVVALRILFRVGSLSEESSVRTHLEVVTCVCVCVTKG